jgi:hypothetical protein
MRGFVIREADDGGSRPGKRSGNARANELAVFIYALEITHTCGTTGFDPRCETARITRFVEVRQGDEAGIGEAALDGEVVSCFSAERCRFGIQRSTSIIKYMELLHALPA